MAVRAVFVRFGVWGKGQKCRRHQPETSVCKRTEQRGKTPRKKYFRQPATMSNRTTKRPPASTPTLPVPVPAPVLTSFTAPSSSSTTLLSSSSISDNVSTKNNKAGGCCNKIPHLNFFLIFFSLILHVLYALYSESRQHAAVFSSSYSSSYPSSPTSSDYWSVRSTQDDDNCNRDNVSVAASATVNNMNTSNTENKITTVNNEDDYTWIGNTFIPPIGVPHYTVEQMKDTLEGKNVLFIGDSTARRSYATLYAILNASDSSDIDKRSVVSRHIIDVGKGDKVHKKWSCLVEYENNNDNDNDDGIDIDATISSNNNQIQMKSRWRRRRRQYQRRYFFDRNLKSRATIGQYWNEPPKTGDNSTDINDQFICRRMSTRRLYNSSITSSDINQGGNDKHQQKEDNGNGQYDYSYLFDYGSKLCFHDIIDIVETDLNLLRSAQDGAGVAHTTIASEYDIVIIALGIWEAIRQPTCYMDEIIRGTKAAKTNQSKAINHGNKTLSIDDRILQQAKVMILKLEQWSQQTNLTIVIRTVGFDGSGSGKILIKRINQLIRTMINTSTTIQKKTTVTDAKNIDMVDRDDDDYDDDDDKVDAKNVGTLIIVDWAKAIENRSFHLSRIFGDIPAHYGLEARLLFIQMLIHKLKSLQDYYYF